MSDGRSFVGSIPYARIRNLHLEGETRHDRGTAGAALRNPLLPDKAILALAVVADVAVHRPYGRVTGEMLAKRRGLSSRYLEPLLQALVHHGILRGVRGPRGGYELGRDGERISAADILRAAADEIRHESGSRSSGPDQTVARAIEQAEKVFSDALARISLADLTGSRMRTSAE